MLSKCSLANKSQKGQLPKQMLSFVPGLSFLFFTLFFFLFFLFFTAFCLLSMQTPASCVKHGSRLCIRRSPAPCTKRPCCAATCKEKRPHSPRARFASRVPGPPPPLDAYARGTSLCIHQTHALCPGTEGDKIAVCQTPQADVQNYSVSSRNSSAPHCRFRESYAPVYKGVHVPRLGMQKPSPHELEPV